MIMECKYIRSKISYFKNKNGDKIHYSELYIAVLS